MDLSVYLGPAVEAMRAQRGALTGRGATVTGVRFSGFLALWRDILGDGITVPIPGPAIQIDTVNPSIYPAMLELARIMEAQRDYLTARGYDMSDAPFARYVDYFLDLLGTAVYAVPTAPGFTAEPGNVPGRVIITLTDLPASWGDALASGDGLGTPGLLQFWTPVGGWQEMIQPPPDGADLPETYTLDLPESQWGLEVQIRLRGVSDHGREGAEASETVTVPLHPVSMILGWADDAPLLGFADDAPLEFF